MRYFYRIGQYTRSNRIWDDKLGIYLQGDWDKNSWVLSDKYIEITKEIYDRILEDEEIIMKEQGRTHHCPIIVNDLSELSEFFIKVLPK